MLVLVDIFLRFLLLMTSPVVDNHIYVILFTITTVQKVRVRVGRQTSFYRFLNSVYCYQCGYKDAVINK